VNTKSLRKIAFVTEEFSTRSPAQQLLDRFLIGYPRDGEFHRITDCQFVLNSASAESADVKSRVSDFGLQIAARPADAVAEADAVVVTWRGSGAVANHALIEATLQASRPGTSCFVYGTLANDAAAAAKFVSLAKTRKIALCSGAGIGVTYRLPEIEVPEGAQLREGLIVVQGPALDAEFDALDGLLPVLARRRNGEAGVERVRFLAGDAIWAAGKAGDWPLPLLAAAISRSNTVQGDPLKDGRTQNVVGLGLVPVLAKNPRCWLLDHRDRVKSTLLVLDGVVADYNFAVRLAGGAILSAQLYRPPPPMQDQFSRLAALIEDFCRSGIVPWPIERSVLVASLLEKFGDIDPRRPPTAEVPASKER
jgi:hypothetical protein